VTSVFLSTASGYLLVGGVFGGCLFWLVLTGRTKIRVPRKIAWLYLFILSLFVTGTIMNPSVQGIIRTLTFATITSVIILMLVYDIDFTIFWRMYGVATASVVIIGLPTVFINQFSLGPFVITAYSTTPTAPINIGINTISSIFSNPNNLALVCCFAVIGLVTTQTLSRATALLAAINIFGVFMADGQAAQLATIAGIGIFAVGKFNRSLVKIITTVALVGITIGLLLVFQLIPGPETLSTISLSGRRHLWQASVQALKIRPLIGYGPVNMSNVLEPYITNPTRTGVGPHNSYIRIALSNGILGGILYTLIHLYALLQTARQSNLNSLSSHAMLWAAVVIQIFNGATIFGISSSSILFAIALGWSLHELSENNKTYLFQTG